MIVLDDEIVWAAEYKHTYRTMYVDRKQVTVASFLLFWKNRKANIFYKLIFLLAK